MADKRNSIILYLFGGLGILLALLVISIMENSKPPKNVKHEGGMAYIDISDEATDESLKKELLYVVPDSFNPRVYESGFSVFISSTDGSPLSGNDMPKPVDEVLLSVRYVKGPDQMASVNMLKRTQSNNGPLKNVPSLVERKNGMEIYQYDYGQNETTIGKIYSFTTKEGDPIIVDDPGDWSWGYKVARKYTDHIQLRYQFSKKHIHDQKSFIADVMRVDKAVVEVVKSFQTK